MAELTTIQAAQLLACKENWQFFFEKFYKIAFPGRGAIEFRLRDYQVEVCRTLDKCDRVIGLKARQIGWTTIAMAYVLYDALFNDEHSWLLVSKDEDAAQLMLHKVKYAINRLPKWMKDVLPSWHGTKTEIEFGNGSRIQAVPATGSTGRGDSVWGVLMDEAAFMEYATEIWGAVEPLAYGKIMVFSTANGMGNFFHDVWLDSQREDSVWTGLFFPWHVVPDRDEDWYNRKRLGFRGVEWLFFQEYPASPEEAFAKSGRVAFEHGLVDACFVELEPEFRLKYSPGQPFSLLKDGEWADIEISVWRPPVQERDERNRLLRPPNYVVAADFAEGLEHGDFTYVTVFNCNAVDGRFEQVAACRSSVPIAYSADLLEQLGNWYFEALIVGERNAAGVMPMEMLGNVLWYPRLYRMDRFGEMPTMEDRTTRYGWFTDRKSKPKMVHDFVLALTEGQVVLHDKDFVLEAQMFVADGKGSYSATPGRHDDVVMGTLLGWQGVLDSSHYAITWVDDVLPPMTHEEMDALMFASERRRSPLDTPIGVKVEKVKKTFMLSEGNLR